MIKRLCKCGRELHKQNTSGMCHQCYGKDYRNKPENKKRLAKMRYEYYQKHKKRIIENASRRNAQLKNEIIQKLGGRCACCKETQREFLTLDHIKSGGNREYKRKGAMMVYAQVKREGFPKDKYRILCWNCNASLGFYGYCPHSDLKSPCYHSSKNHISHIKNSG